jgi:hypothetical protein
MVTWLGLGLDGGVELVAVAAAVAVAVVVAVAISAVTFSPGASAGAGDARNISLPWYPRAKTSSSPCTRTLDLSTVHSGPQAVSGVRPLFVTVFPANGSR